MATKDIIGKQFEILKHKMKDCLPTGKYEYLRVNDQDVNMFFYLVKNIETGSEHGASSIHLNKLISRHKYKPLING